jgi:hypothetical protein
MKIKCGAVVAAAMLVLISTSAVAAAKAVKATAPLLRSAQKGEVVTGCWGGPEPMLPVIGTVKFKRVGEAITVTTSVKQGVPDASYVVTLMHPVEGECQGQAASGGAFTTNGAGNGHSKRTTNAPLLETQFYAGVQIDPRGFPYQWWTASTQMVSLP